MDIAQPTREALLHRLYEAAATARWRRVILDVAIEEMGDLCAVWNLGARRRPALRPR